MACVMYWQTKQKGFQSIGVTKDWRPLLSEEQRAAQPAFPINRRHQGLATCHAGALSTDYIMEVSNQ